MCAVMSGIALEQISYMEVTFTFPFCLRKFIILKILIYLCITKSQPLGQCWLSKESDALTYVRTPLSGGPASCNRVRYKWYWLNVCITTLQVARAFSWHLPLHCMPPPPSPAGSLEFTTDLTAPPMASLHSSLSVMDGETNRYNIEPNASFSLTYTAESPDDFALSVSRMPSSATSAFTSDVADSMTTMPSTFVKTLILTYSPFTADLNGIYWCQAVSSTTSNELDSRRILLGTGQCLLAHSSTHPLHRLH